ncbi:MAG: hypothetical protein Q4F51_06890, partial [Sarcina sp.]|nr:hypothetical protein [Sarcina sp.]
GSHRCAEPALPRAAENTAVRAAESAATRSAGNPARGKGFPGKHKHKQKHRQFRNNRENHGFAGTAG